MVPGRWGRERRAGRGRFGAGSPRRAAVRPAAMEDYERELYGVEDDFDNQFAAELEVLAELEGRRGHRRGLVPGSLTEAWPSRGVQEGCSEGRAGARPQPPWREQGPAAALAARAVAVCADELPRMTAVGLPSAGTAALSPSRDPQPTVGRPRLTFEEAIAGGETAIHCSPGGPPRSSKGSVRKRQLASDIQGDRYLPPSTFLGPRA